MPFKIKGEWDYEYETDERDGGARYNMNAAGTSLVMVGYFTMSGGDDDVSQNYWEVDIPIRRHMTGAYTTQQFKRIMANQGCGLNALIPIIQEI